MFGVHVTLLKNHMYGITQTHKGGKMRVLQKVQEKSLFNMRKRSKQSNTQSNSHNKGLKWRKLHKRKSCLSKIGF